MVSIPQRPALTYAQFLELEARERDARYELVDGEAWLMTGGTPRHSRIMSNAVVALAGALGDGPCQVYVSDLRVRLDEDTAVYPDVAVACEPLEHPPDDRLAVTNPVVVIEVLSKSTELWDRTGKFLKYQQLASLQHYLLVSQVEPKVDYFARTDVGTWAYKTYWAGDRIRLASLGLALEVDALYRNLPAE